MDGPLYLLKSFKKKKFKKIKKLHVLVPLYVNARKEHSNSPHKWKQTRSLGISSGGRGANISSGGRGANISSTIQNFHLHGGHFAYADVPARRSSK